MEKKLRNVVEILKYWHSIEESANISDGHSVGVMHWGVLDALRIWNEGFLGLWGADRPWGGLC
jgi:hypothetical protein